MSMSEWAKREVELAIEKEGEFDYGVGCYKSALKAFDSLMEDGHSGFSIGVTACILNRLIKGLPLTPIEDTDDIWSRSFTDSNGNKHYQCGRMPSLFKCVHPNGTITYSDSDRIICYSSDNPEISYHSSLASRVINEMFPITMPYYPNLNPYKVYCERHPRNLYSNHVEEPTTRFVRDNKIEKVIFNDPATIVFWDDGTKTVTKCHGDDIYDETTGLLVCISKKFLGGASALKKTIDKWVPKEKNEDEKSKDEEEKSVVSDFYKHCALRFRL